ncbi:MAG: ABC transporter permease subunit [Anaerolineales bacterium]|nr:ABC transporter permease subunit [Anaerolineales bacterium]MCX7608662.1 ABC transporter permease subunit [Anaerolineales bacterium]MDW8226220.1 ABC transporter permease subunit [Anaerolineales bacterium]
MSNNSSKVALEQRTPKPPFSAFLSSLLNWAGLLPFLLFVFFFLLLPSFYLFVGSFQDAQGRFTLDNIRALFTPSILSAYWVTIRISITTALLGGVIGFFLAYGLLAKEIPAWLRSSLMTFFGVASNFAGVPLAQAFIFTLGRVGLVTVFLREVLHFDPYEHGFNLYSFWGLSITYLYFQLPLMVLVITPAIEGLKKDWREAAENLGATSWQYWRYVGVPVLMPSLLGAMILLFGNSFGAYATAISLTGGLINLITILIGIQIRGDVLHNPNLGYALALGMVVVMALMMTIYYLLRRRSEYWLKS